MTERWHGTISGYNYHKCRCENCKESKRKEEKKYRERNLEKIIRREKERRNTPERKEWTRLYNKKYRETHRNEKNDNEKKRRIKFRDEILEKEKLKRLSRTEKIKEIKSRWYNKHKDKALAYYHNRRAAIVGNGGVHTADEWNKLLSYYGKRCLKCGSDENIQKDHVVPLSAGGTNDIKNLQPLCRRCNLKKHDSAMDYRPSLPDWVFDRASPCL